MIEKINNIIKKEDIEFVCRVMSNTFMLPIHFLDESGKVIFEASERYINNPIFSCKDDILNSLIENNDIYNFPIIRTNDFYETFFYISIKDCESLIGTFIVGPALLCNISYETVDEVLQHFNFPIRYKSSLINYYNKLPVMNNNNLLNFSLALYYSIYNKKLEIEVIKQKNYKLGYTTPDMKNSIDLILSESRKDSMLHIPYEYERLVFQYIKEGNHNKVLDLLYSPPSGKAGTLSKGSILRHFKNQFIYACALTYSAAIDGGLNHEIAHILSEQYIQQVEELKNIQDIEDLRIKMFLDFTDRVYVSKNKKQSSKAISICKNFIFNNIYKDIKLSQLAKLVNLNPNYLSELFSKEVGMTISRYIQKERIEEAKKLLSLTDYSLSDISTLLNFGAQSYFSTIFKKVTGVTPKEYKDLNKIT